MFRDIEFVGMKKLLILGLVDKFSYRVMVIALLGSICLTNYK